MKERDARLSAEPFLWLGFSAGGIVVALMVPALLFLFGLAFPLGWLAAPDHAHVLALLAHPLTRVILFLFCFLSLAHSANRLRFTLIDGLKLRRYDSVIVGVTYTAALLGAAFAAQLLLETF